MTQIDRNQPSMENWLTLLVDPLPIRSIYGDFVPTLRSVNLHEVIIHRDGPKVVLRFDLADFPEFPPKKWNASKFNTVQVCLLMIGVKKLFISGFDRTCILDISIHKDDNDINLSAISDNVQISIISSFATIDKVSAYLKSV